MKGFRFESYPEQGFQRACVFEGKDGVQGLWFTICGVATHYGSTQCVLFQIRVHTQNGNFRDGSLCRAPFGASNFQGQGNVIRCNKHAYVVHSYEP